MKRPFDEAWMDRYGEVFHTNASHYSIAKDYIRVNDPETFDLFGSMNYDDEYSAVYDYMYEHGCARLFASGSSLYIETSKKFPDHVINLMEKAKRLVKDSDWFKELVCDRTMRVLYSKKDIL